MSGPGRFGAVVTAMVTPFEPDGRLDVDGAVVLAKWLAIQPRLVLLDEPTRGIDVGAKVAVYRLMRQLAAEGKAILMATNDVGKAAEISPRTIWIEDGRVRADGPTPDVLDRYRDRSVSLPILSPQVRSLNLSTCVGIALYEVLRQRGARPREVLVGVDDDGQPVAQLEQRRGRGLGRLVGLGVGRLVGLVVGRCGGGGGHRISCRAARGGWGWR